MTSSKLREKVVAERISWIRGMTENIKSLPLESFDLFISDKKNVASAESYLRRGLEGLMDLGRHILSKGMGKAVSEYKEIPKFLLEDNIIDKKSADLLLEMAGYRNRMVHYYHEISSEELYEICTQNLNDFEYVLNSIIQWIKKHPEKIDKSL